MSRKSAAFDPISLLNENQRPVTIATPEGVLLEFEVASMGQRLSAFLLDMFIISVSNVLVMLALSIIFGLTGFAVAWVYIFLSLNFYFPFCEYRWGATPGKRAAGIRVIDRAGAVLTLEAVLARNFMRILEFQIPFMYLREGGQAFGLLPAWLAPLAYLWILGLLLFPFATRNRLRLGDFIGGTMVVEAPKPRLLQDLAGGTASDRLSFSAEQLSVYGRVELQVLEDLLRRPATDAKPVAARVATRIKKRIGWTASGRVVGDREFLEAFYRAQREELERLLAFGRGRESKSDSADR